MSGVERRLGRLTTIFRAADCPTCRDWERTTVEIGRADELPVHLPRPDHCPDCRRPAPRITHVVQIIRPDDEERGIAR